MPVTHPEEVLERGPEEVDDHDAAVALLAGAVDPGHAGAAHREPTEARNIGVITPYHAQVRKIRKLLRDACHANVDVGSIEIFQGQVRRQLPVVHERMRILRDKCGQRPRVPHKARNR